MLYNEMIQPDEAEALRALVDVGCIQFIKYLGRMESDRYLASPDGVFFGLGEGSVVQIKPMADEHQPHQSRIEIVRRIQRLTPHIRGRLRYSTDVELPGFGPRVERITVGRTSSGASARWTNARDTYIEMTDSSGVGLYVYLDTPGEVEPPCLCLSLNPNFIAADPEGPRLVFAAGMQNAAEGPDQAPTLATDDGPGLAPALGGSDIGDEREWAEAMNDLLFPSVEERLVHDRDLLSIIRKNPVLLTGRLTELCEVPLIDLKTASDEQILAYLAHLGLPRESYKALVEPYGPVAREFYFPGEMM